MGITYFKRYRMELELSRWTPTRPPTPPGYRLSPWAPELLEAHIEAKHRSFCFEIDANVFPCLGEREGCRRLLREIVARPGFLPGAMWLLQWEDVDGWENCGTIQGICEKERVGAVQNLGIVSAHRGRGLGTCLMHSAMIGFMDAGLQRVTLEVTAQNLGAVRLYERLGFQKVKTMYKAIEVAFA